jgi:glycosyltransferase involved in cell wall biosynthesis
MVKNVFLRLMDKLSDFIVCNSRLAAEVTAARSGLKKEKVTVIYNGIAFDETVEMVHPSIERNEVVIGLVARLVPLKGVTTLLKAFSEIYSKGNVRLVIVGDGPSRVTLEEETLSLGIADKVNFLGERLDAKEIIKGFDIGVLTSEYEGLSNAIMEYMQAGKPVVASKVGGNPELVEDGVTGYLFDYGQADQLAKILNNLIATPDRRLEMGARGHNKIIKHFSINSMMNNWENQL